MNVNFPNQAKQAVRYRNSFITDTKGWANARPITVEVKDLSGIDGLEHKTIAKNETADRIVLEGKRAVEKLRLATEEINSLNNVAIDFAKKVRELDAYIDTLEQMARQANHWKEVAYANKGTAEQYDRERAELQETIAKMKRERAHLEEAVNAFEAENREEKEELEREKAALQKNIESLNTAAQNKLREANDALRIEAERAKRNQSAAQELVKEQAKNADLMKQYNALVAERDTINKNVEKFYQENQGLKTAISTANATLAQVQGESRR